MNKLLIILGPTATGKTDLAISLARKFDGEVVACDSRQVYKGLDIGTGKHPSALRQLEDKVQSKNLKKGKGFWEIGSIKVWMYDIVSLRKQYTVADYVKDARVVLDDIKKRGKVPILVGGTGLYEKALIEGLSSLQAPLDKKLRDKLTNLSLKQLQKKLQKVSPKKWELLNNSDRNNPRRLIRAIELLSAKDQVPSIQEKRFDTLKIGLNAPRDILYEKINKRVYIWIEEGIVDEVKNLRKRGVSKKRFRALGLEYAVVVDYLDGKINIEEMIERMQTKVRQYAKRQNVWFKKEKDITWFDVTTSDYEDRIVKQVSNWYN